MINQVTKTPGLPISPNWGPTRLQTSHIQQLSCSMMIHSPVGSCIVTIQRLQGLQHSAASNVEIIRIRQCPRKRSQTAAVCAPVELRSKGCEAVSSAMAANAAHWPECSQLLHHCYGCVIAAVCSTWVPAADGQVTCQSQMPGDCVSLGTTT
jgi:hypothetical protein